jgi:Protein of unknown function (DUF1553)/Protein of unknown function (DUF1549)/Planctomycete cytochrome C/Concanavalin A-like lectin/glucanases superfamily
MLVVGLGTSSVGLGAEPSRPVEFNHDILPILSDKCFACHGPDTNRRKAKLRLDTEEGIFAERDDGDQIVVPGNSEASELFTRLTDTDEARRMPQRESNLSRLTPSQIGSIKRWIDAGAVFKKHWAFIAPQRPELPRPRAPFWTRNPIDQFVLARLESEGLQPSPEADKAVLLRRVSFDLTGLPPTSRELDSFMSDKSPNAYEKQVDRLLASTQYGENMARMWLDLARYADSNGFAEDRLLVAWPWRDWVVNAYNQNMPYDQFTIRQLAGDLLPTGSLEDKIATGFNRNNVLRYNGDGHDEENRIENVIDRVSTVGTTWLGLTLGCARCHDHKYDPVTQEDFYSLSAFFNNVPEGGRTPNGNASPVVDLASRAQKQQLEALQQQIYAIRARLPEKDMVQQENLWRATALTNLEPPPSEGLIGHYEFEENLKDSSDHTSDAGFTGIRRYEDGVVGQAFRFDGATELSFNGIGDFRSDQAFALAFWLNSSSDGAQTVLQRRDDSKAWNGYELALEDPEPGTRSRTDLRIVVRIASRWPEQAIEIQSRAHCIHSDPIVGDTQFDDPREARHLVLNYDGSGKARGVALYLDGKPLGVDVVRESPIADFRTRTPLTIGDDRSGPPFRGAIADMRIYNRALSPTEAAALTSVVPTRALLKTLAARPTTSISTLDSATTAERGAVTVADDVAPQLQLSELFLKFYAPKWEQEAYTHLLELLDAKSELEHTIPSAMVMSDMPRPRESFVLGRGQYDNKQEKVTPGVLAFLLPLPKDSVLNRLSLARWLVDPTNPLPARVEVNREWQNFFGVGLVKTAENFGLQGESPSHPELLDWLATEFVRRGWDVKAIQRLIVTSATYRQSSRVTSMSWDRDPENRLLARGPRVRLAAEELRDNALAVSGLLSRKMGGPSVFPYAPTGFWRSGARSDEYTQSSGEDLYRRSLYTVWRRTIAPASFYSFDIPMRDRCTARRIRTNTPLQALTLLNDPTYVEASRALAEKAIRAHGADLGRRLNFAFRSVMLREPAQEERLVLLKQARSMAARFHRDPSAARRLLRVGDYHSNGQDDPAELAAWTVVVRTILNLNESITKE